MRPRHLIPVALTLLAALAAPPAAPAAEAGRVSFVPASRAGADAVVFRLPTLRPESVLSATLVRGEARERVARATVRHAAVGGLLRVRRPLRTRAGRLRLRLVVDTLAPRTRIVGGPATAGGRVGVWFAADDSSARFRCRLDRGAWTPCTSPAVYPSPAAGRHVFAVRALDGAGNMDPSPATVTWTVAAAAPPRESPPSAPAPSPAPAPAPAPPARVAAPLPMLSDAEAAARVRRSGWEPRPGNATANHRTPTSTELADYRRARGAGWCNGADLRVTGDFTGTTDEILQWAAAKWSLDPDVLRAVAVTESYWRHSTLSDYVDGVPESFGLLQVRVTVHHGTGPLAHLSTAFNADYYGAIVRYYLDGCADWLNDVERGERYAPGDVWGSVGAWYAGRWYTAAAEDYIATVRRHLRARTWAQPGF